MKKILLFISLIFLSVASSAQAATLYLYTKISEVKTSSFFEVSLALDSQDESINAVEGKLYFPKNLLEFVSTKESDSIISFWIKKPELQNNYVSFSGIVPGGYTGQGNLFKLIFKTKQIGQANLEIKDFKVLLNDGLGTEASTSVQAISLNIRDDASAGEDVVIVDLSDQDPPEPFTPIISQIPEIAGQNYLLMFNTQDKGSGIDYYQVKEGYRPFVQAESPYLLKNQELDREIVVKAVDKSGNERKVTIAPVYPAPWYENFAIFAIILIVIVAAFILGRASWTKTKRK